MVDYLDDLNRPNGPLGPNWHATGTSPFSIVNNQIVGGTACAARWRRRTSGAQYSQITFRGGTLVGPSVAMPRFAGSTFIGGAATLTAAGTWYTFRSQGATAGVAIVQKDAGATTNTVLLSLARNLVAGDVLRLEYDGAVLTAKINGTTVLTHTPTSPISIANQPYVGVSHGSSSQSGTVLFDDWVGGGAYSGPAIYTSIPKAIDFPFSNVNLPTGWNSATYSQFSGLRDGGTRVHRSNDLIVPYGTPVYAVCAGTIDAGYMPGYTEPITPGVGGGYQLRVDTTEGLRYVYAHFGPDTVGSTSQAFAPGIVPGAAVTKGQLLGWAGVSGSTDNSGAHLHFEIRDLASLAEDDPTADYAATLGTEAAARYDPNPSLVDAKARPAPAPPPVRAGVSNTASGLRLVRGSRPRPQARPTEHVDLQPIGLYHRSGPAMPTSTQPGWDGLNMDDYVKGYVVNLTWEECQPNGPDDPIPDTTAVTAAIQTYQDRGLPFKVRPFSGVSAPGWIKTLGGTAPMTMIEPQGGTTYQLGKFWDRLYVQHQVTWHQMLFEKWGLEPGWVDCSIPGPMTYYAEPAILGVGGILPEFQQNRDALLAGGYNIPEHDQAYYDLIDCYAGFKGTCSMAMNAIQQVSPTGAYSKSLAKSMAIMDYIRKTLRSHGALGNNSVRHLPDNQPGAWDAVNNIWPGGYALIYPRLAYLGARGHVYFQTATPNRIGNLYLVCKWAVEVEHATMIELPGGTEQYTSNTPVGMTPDQFDEINAKMQANADAQLGV